MRDLEEAASEQLSSSHGPKSGETRAVHSWCCFSVSKNRSMSDMDRENLFKKDL